MLDYNFIFKLKHILLLSQLINELYKFYIQSIILVIVVVVGLPSFRPRFAGKCGRQSRDFTKISPKLLIMFDSHLG